MMMIIAVALLSGIAAGAEVRTPGVVPPAVRATVAARVPPAVALKVAAKARTKSAAPCSAPCQQEWDACIGKKGRSTCFQALREGWLGACPNQETCVPREAGKIPTVAPVATVARVAPVGLPPIRLTAVGNVGQ